MNRRALAAGVVFSQRFATVPLRDAVERGLAYLLACQLPSGAVNDPLADPVGALARRRSRRTAFRLTGGADLWHTVQALRALRACGRTDASARRFVTSKLTAQGELSYWSIHPSLCIETCAAACEALPGLRVRLRRTIERNALPGGRWPNFILPGRGGYDAYLTGPSVTGFALGVLGGGHRLANAARAYLAQTLEADGLWRPHGAFYATPFYPAHVAVAHLRDRRPVVQATLRRQDGSGGWSFGADASARPSALPTALALWTLVAAGLWTRQAMRAARRAVAWLMGAQRKSGAFPVAPAPAALFYAGDVYATAVAIMALIRAQEALA